MNDSKGPATPTLFEEVTKQKQSRNGTAIHCSTAYTGGNDDEKENLWAQQSAKQEKKEPTRSSVKKKSTFGTTQIRSPMSAQTWTDKAPSTTANDDGDNHHQAKCANSRSQDDDLKHAPRPPKHGTCLSRKRPMDPREWESLRTQIWKEMDRAATVADNEILATIHGLQDFASQHGVILDGPDDYLNISQFRTHLEDFLQILDENRKKYTPEPQDNEEELIRRNGRALVRCLKRGLRLRPKVHRATHDEQSCWFAFCRNAMQYLQERKGVGQLDSERVNALMKQMYVMGE